MVLLVVVITIIVAYLLLSLGMFYLVQNYPRNPVDDVPDWGTVTDTRIPAIDGGSLEVWRVEPAGGASKGIVVIAHGWGRNRGRMVHRARIFGQWGFTTVMHSARDHGNSSRRRNMNAYFFSQDIEAVLRWIGEPVILYGHSAGSAGAIIAAHRNPDKIRLLFLEAGYPYTEEALISLYRWVNPVFGLLFARLIIFWMNLFYDNMLDKVSPARLAPDMDMPVMLIHGEKDRRFPVEFAYRLKDSFTHNRIALYVGPDANHSDSSHKPGYQEAVKQFLDQYLTQVES
jgi:pimeloyl-ACP methyl ester carboxylesterase